jgi:PAS domain S-box-containing protein
LRDELELRVDTAVAHLVQVGQRVRSAGMPSLTDLQHIFQDAKFGGRISDLVVCDPDLTILFSPQHPSEVGQIATRSGLTRARTLDMAAVGFEADPSGHYFLRVVLRIVSGSKTAGYVEISLEPAIIFADFRQRAGTDVYLVPFAEGRPGAALSAELEARLGDNHLVDHLRRFLSAPADAVRSETVSLQGSSHDIFAIHLRSGVASGAIDIVAIRDASARESMLRQILVRRSLMWALSTMVFLGTCLWLCFRLAGHFKQREQERFSEREQRVRAVMDAVVDAIVTIRTDGTIVTFNPAAETIFGYSAAEAIGQNAGILMDSGLAAQHQGHVERYLQTGQKHIIGVKREVRGRRKDGTEFPMDIAISQSTVGEEVIFIGVMRDVTERKLANDLLMETLRHQKEAQLALRRRSDELVRAAKALARARDKAEAANEAKSRFLAAMSHELRTPMNGILGMAGLLASSPLGAEQRKWASLIRESGEALLTLLNDILDLSKIEAGRFQIRPAPFDPRQVARQLIVSWEHQAAEKGITLSLEGPDELPSVIGDAMRVRQILTNFVSNAVKFTERGFVTVKISVVEESGAALKLRYDVADTGVGIAEDKLPLLFEKFSEIDISASRQHNGAGLGLAICREMAMLMEGHVGVESMLGIGSVFWIELKLPLEHAEPVMPPPLALPEPDPNGDGRDRRLRILVAEDHPVNQKLFQALIGHMGHEVTLVSNGHEAVAAVMQGGFDLVLMDANMPVMDGVEATRQIRALPGPEARVPIVAVTADAMVGDRERLLGLGMDDYLTKPIDARELAALIARYGEPRSEGNAEKPTANRERRLA